MKYRKWLLAVLFTLIFVLALIPATVFAETTVNSGKLEDNLTWELNSEGTLTISGNGALREPEGQNLEDLFEINSSVKKVIIKDGVTNVWMNFGMFENLKSVYIPGSVQIIGNNVFENVRPLEYVKVESGVKEIRPCAFAACWELKEVVLPNSITKIGTEAFRDCTKLEKINIPNKLEVIEEDTFLCCYALEDIVIPNSVRTIEAGAFYSCRSLKYLTIPKSVRILQTRSFGMCTSLIAVEFKGDAIHAEGRDAVFGTGNTIKGYYPADNETWTFGKRYDFGKYFEWYPTPLQIGTVTASNNSTSGKPQLKWEKVDGAEKYEIFRATTKNGTYKKLWDQESTIYTNTSAEVGKTYYYKVRTVDPFGNKGKFSAIKSITCDCAKPVTTLTINADSGKPKMTWKKVDGASKYEVYRATSKSGTYSKMLTTTGTTYTNTTAVPGKTYYYKVKAICGATTYGNSAFSTVKSITCDCARPVVTIGRNTKTGKPQLKWKAVEGATKYEIYRATSKNGTYYKQYTQQSTTYTNTTAKAGTTYYYKVKAICGKSSYGNSALSAVKSITSK